jgi:hypothetical protein
VLVRVVIVKGPKFAPMGACLPPPLGMAGAVLAGLVVAEALEGMRQGPRPLGGGRPGAGAIREALAPVVGQAMAPVAPRRRGKVEGGRDGSEAVPCDALAYGLSTPEHPGLLGVVQDRG